MGEMLESTLEAAASSAKTNGALIATGGPGVSGAIHG